MRRQAVQPRGAAGLDVGEWTPPRPWPIPAETVSEVVAVVADACRGRRSGPAGLATALRSVCRVAGFEVGHAYLSCTATGRIVPSSIWYLQPPASRYLGFVRTTSSTVLVPGQGLPGQVVSHGVPVCIHPLSDGAHAPRARAALAAGLRAACGYPIEANPELTVVLEFLATGPVARSSELDTLVERVGEVLHPHLQGLDQADLEPVHSP